MAPLTPAGPLSGVRQVSLLHVLNLLVVPSPITLRHSDHVACFSLCDQTYRRGRSEERASSVCKDMLASVGLRHRGCGLAVNGGPNRVRHPTDRSFTSWCSPPPLARTQFHSVTAARPATDRDFHPAGSIHLQSHSPPARAGGTAGRWAIPAPGNPLNRSQPSARRRPTKPQPACTKTSPA